MPVAAIERRVHEQAARGIADIDCGRGSARARLARQTDFGGTAVAKFVLRTDADLGVEMTGVLPEHAVLTDEHSRRQWQTS